MADMRKLVIPGKLPTLNEYVDACRTSAILGNKFKREHQESVMWRIKQQIRKPYFTGKVTLEYFFYEENERRDVDNVASFAMKVIQDALVKLQVIHDDSQKYLSHFACNFDVDKSNPRIEVIIKEAAK